LQMTWWRLVLLSVMTSGSSSAMAATRGRGSSSGRDYGGSNRGRGHGRGKLSRGGGNNRARQGSGNLSRHRFEEDYVPKPHTTADTSSVLDHHWYTDSDATDHITGDLDKLTMHDNYTSSDQIRARNGIGMDITRIGKTIIPTSHYNLALNNVLHVPSTEKILFPFIGLLLIMIHLLNFTHIFLIKDRKTRKVLLHGPCKGGLYPLPPSSSRFRKLIFSAIKIPAVRWHSRLDHPAHDIVRRVMSMNNLACTSFDLSSGSVCDACACAKARYLPYSLSSNRSSVQMELIFLDVWVLLLTPLVAKNIMLASSMIIANSLGLFASF
jgi:hypothetical protein